MLSIRKMGSAGDATKYYTKTATDYYLKGDVELMAEFYGKAAEGNTFNNDTFERVLHGFMEGVSPKSNDEKIQLGKPNGQGGIEHVAGWDLTFSAPKSISMAALIKGDTRLLDAHNKAVKSALGHLEEHGMYARKTNDNETKMVNTGNMFASIFTHTTSRALDPQLHSHSVIANATLDKNGKWCSVESKPLFDAKMTTGLIYRSELAHLTKQLGYEIRITNKNHCFFELASINDKEIKVFSKRGEQIKEAATERGLTSQKQLDLAAVMTRKSKTNISANELDAAWKLECQNANINLDDRVPLNQVAPELLTRESDIVEDVRLAYRSLATQEAAFSSNAIISKVLKTGFGDYSPTAVQGVINDFKTQGELLVHKNGFTTPKAVNVESKIIRTALNMQGQYAPIANEAKVSNWLEERNNTQLSQGGFAYTDGQSESIKHIVTTSDGVVNINGWAGVGKTTMLNGVKSFTSDTDIIIRGIAPTGSATETLFKETGIKSQTTDSFLYLHDVNPDKTAHNELWLVDESSLMNAENTLKLFQVAEKKGARIVNLGDAKQLGSVEWGKTFAQLQAVGIATSNMQDILRQINNKNYLDAVVCAANGDIKGAFSHVKDSFEQSSNPVTSLVEQYRTLSIDERESSIFVIPDNETKVSFMTQAREVRQEEGLVSHDEIKTTILTNSNLDRVELTDARMYEKGFIVEFQHDEKALGVKRGDMFTVQESGKRGEALLLKGSNSNEVISWNPSVLSKKDNSKFSVTVFKEQDRSFAVGDKVKWTKGNKALGLINGDLGEVKELNVTSGIAKIDFGKGEHLSLDLSQKQTIDWAYADTAFSSQGKTYEKAFGILESWRKNLVHQQSFYVALSRGKSEAKFFIDDKAKLIKELSVRTGEKTSALHSQEKLDAVKANALTNKQSHIDTIHSNAKAAIAHSSSILSENKGIFSHSDLISHSLKYGFGKLTAKILESEIDSFLKTKELSVLKVSQKSYGEKFYSTGEHLKKEASLATMALQGVGARRPFVSKSYGNAFIDSKNWRSEQFGDTKAVSEIEAKAINNILSTKNESLIINANNSKDVHDLMFGIIKTALKPRGVEVRPLTLRSATKEHLEANSVKAQNALAFSEGVARKITSGQKISYRKEIWFVDDASLLSIEDTKKIMDVARATGARLVFSEDQHEEPIKGVKAMAVLKSQNIPTIDLSEKSHSGALSKANFEARKGAIDKAVGHIEDRIIEVDNPIKSQGAALRINSAVDTYLNQDIDDRSNTHVVITDRYTRQQFTEIVREKLATANLIGKENKSLLSLKNNFMSPIEMKHARYYKNDMIIRFDKDRGDLKGNYGYMVSHVDIKKNVLTLTDGERKFKWSPDEATFSNRYSQQVFTPERLQLSTSDRVRLTESKYNTETKSYDFKSGQIASVKSINGDALVLSLPGGRTATLDTNAPLPLEHGYSTSHFSLKHSQEAKQVIAIMDSNKPHSVDKKALINLLGNSKKLLTIITDNKEKVAKALKEQPLKPDSALASKAIKVNGNNKEHNKTYGLVMPNAERAKDKLEQKMHDAIQKFTRTQESVKAQQIDRQLQK